MRIRKEDTTALDLADEEISLIAKVSDALAHPARIKMLRYIMDCNKKRSLVCNKDLVEEFGYAQSTVSQHMNKLKHSGLIEYRRDDRKTCFYVNLGLLAKFLNTAKKI